VSLPLEGVRVLDLSRLLPGGFCSLLLADFGADVLKVEDTGMGDYVRWAAPYYEGVEDSARSALFLSLNRGKRSMRLNLKTDGGREVLLRAVAEADVVLESFRPGVLDRLGVGYEAMRAVNPRIVYCAISGYGQDGPLRDRSGHDMNYLGLVGLLGLTGDRDGPPTQAAGQIADLGGGALMAAFGILAALRERDVSGEGQLVDVSMADGALSWLAMVAARALAEGVTPQRGGLELAGSLVCYRPYEASDGWVTLGALEPKFWAAWCRGVEREDLIAKQFEAPGSDTHAEVQAIFAGRTRDEWTTFASEHDCCLEPVLDLDEALDSELVRAREMVVELDQPGATQPVRLLGVPVKLSRTPGDANRAPGPGLGEHTHAVLAELGYGADQIAAMEADGAIAGRSADDAVPPTAFLS
jgi:crotonobetainyl-CoA:carnitine CoA-transferase CaiB-like acyl-CoA transferase